MHSVDLESLERLNDAMYRTMSAHLGPAFVEIQLGEARDLHRLAHFVTPEAFVD